MEAKICLPVANALGFKQDTELFKERGCADIQSVKLRSVQRAKVCGPIEIWGKPAEGANCHFVSGLVGVATLHWCQ